ncbi:MAG: peptidylprolyl isomerase [Rhodoferax sp.]|nr:peptidylprolyl isomerase [Rhodoferax sp.]
MKNFRWTIALACVGSLFLFPAMAQPSTAPAATKQADYIVAVVNSEPITNSELMADVGRLVQQLTQQRQQVPPMEEIRKGVLERMINDKAQIQLARENGLRIDTAEIDAAEQNVARQNQMDVSELRKRLAKDGISPAIFRAQLRDQMTLTRLHEREVSGRIRITDAEVERFLQEQKASSADPYAQEINLAQIVIAVPEKANDEQVAYFATQAKNVLARIHGGENFTKVMQEVSAGDRANGGALGLRKGDRYPAAFIQATYKLPVGGVSDIVRSGAGFHVLKVVERRSPNAIGDSIPETRARHILLRVTPQMSQAVAAAKLEEARQKVVAGKADFAALARELSQDGSAPQGGDLGWARPGMFVPEFEEVMGRLKDGEISPPFASRFGLHLLQVTERRKVEMTPAEVREVVRNQMKEARYEEAFANWARDIRDKAFVEYREPPL